MSVEIRIWADSVNIGHHTVQVIPRKDEFIVIGKGPKTYKVTNVIYYIAPKMVIEVYATSFEEAATLSMRQLFGTSV